MSVNHKFFHKPCRKLIWDSQVNMNEMPVQQAFKVKIELIFALCKTKSTPSNKMPNCHCE
jgi:hypothetical protein